MVCYGFGVLRPLMGGQAGDEELRPEIQLVVADIEEDAKKS